MYCLDTNVVVDIFRGDKNLKLKLEKIKDAFNISITFITLCELYKGAYLYYKPEDKVNDVTNFIAFYGVIDFDVESCKEFGKLYAELQNDGKMIPEIDLMIASIAKVNEAILITRDKKHFEKIKGLKIEVW